MKNNKWTKTPWKEVTAKNGSGSDMSRTTDPAHHKGSTLTHVFTANDAAYHLGIVSSHK